MPRVEQVPGLVIDVLVSLAILIKISQASEYYLIPLKIIFENEHTFSSNSMVVS